MLRRADCLRVLLAWHAFGDLEKCKSLIPHNEKELLGDIERERDYALADVDSSFAPFLEPLPKAREELAEREALAEKELPEGKDEKKKFREEKKANTERIKELKKQLKTLEKLAAEADDKRASIRQYAQREMELARETAADLVRLSSNPAEANRYFAIAESTEIEENEFNLNLPRYVDTFEAEEQIEIPIALAELEAAERSLKEKTERLKTLLGAVR